MTKTGDYETKELLASSVSDICCRAPIFWVQASEHTRTVVILHGGVIMYFSTLHIYPIASAKFDKILLKFVNSQI